ncbi:NAD-dependent epimerase/dehydratase family protein [Baekduia soli]|uniref:NAD-dependent epimerase/dehydratase family protein n=1 Tax=Baekduia soli TaxID=496014 RepID=A0A5B8U7T0_9ACTN|nr:NAD-dependent epimerase/dehydratase family protein [Baekduia soli]QEC48985.1 NAD-dependent epimerase/dehydratase family protein [Baekduia soli]
MRILVTGGAGFVGSHIADQLLEAGHEVRIVDALLPTAHDGGPPWLPAGAEVVTADLRDPEVAAAAVAGVGAVCHQASMVGLGADIMDIADYVAHNDLATAVLLRALARRSFAGRIVLASSMVVYGEGRYACPEHGLVAPGPRATADLDAGRFEPPCHRCGRPLVPQAVPEDAPADPRNVYAATKLHQEHLLAAFAREQDGVDVTALRYHNVYGPRMPRDTPYAGVASIFRSALERGEAPSVFEDGAQIRDFVHVGDVARANVLALGCEEPAPGAYNIASGVPRTVGDMARALAAALPGAPEPVVTGAYRRGDVRHVFASPQRAAEVLGFRARVGLEEGMAEFAHAPLRLPAVGGG